MDKLVLYVLVATAVLSMVAFYCGKIFVQGEHLFSVMVFAFFAAVAAFGGYEVAKHRKTPAE